VSRLLKAVHGGALEKKLISRGAWDPFAFIDLCEGVDRQRSASDQVKLLRQIQGVETDVLLEHFVTRVPQ
jgi:hypothetical protein